MSKRFMEKSNENKMKIQELGGGSLLILKIL